MEFFEFYKTLLGDMPPESASLIAQMEMLLPYITCAFAVLTCFFGYKTHKVWLSFIFFVVTFFASSLACAMLFSINMNASIIIGLIIAAAAAFFADKLHSVWLGIVTFFMAFTSVSDFVKDILPKIPSFIPALICGVAAAFFVRKYKFISVMILTSFTGASILANIIFPEENPELKIARIASIAVFCAMGIACQFFFERKHLKEVEEEAKKPVDKIKSKKAELSGKVAAVKAKGTADIAAIDTNGGSNQVDIIHADEADTVQSPHRTVKTTQVISAEENCAISAGQQNE